MFKVLKKNMHTHIFLNFFLFINACMDFNEN